MRLLLVIIGLLFLLSACVPRSHWDEYKAVTKEGSIEVSVDEEFTLFQGQIVRVAELNLSIEYVEFKIMRCSKNVECFRGEGPYAVVNILIDGQPYHPFTDGEGNLPRDSEGNVYPTETYWGVRINDNYFNVRTFHKDGSMRAIISQSDQ